MRTLKEIKCGEKTNIVKLHGDGPLRKRLIDMGLTKGCEIRVRRIAPLGDPIELTVRGYELSIRKSEAELIEVN
jgi:ferrous iron transport protein A